MNLIFRSWLYDFLYYVGDYTIKKYKPCGIKPGTEGIVQCLVGRLDVCCGGCKYLGGNGCTTRSLGCKLSLCCSLLTSKDVSRARKADDLLRQPRIIASQYGIRIIRSTRCKAIASLMMRKNFKGGM